MDSAESWMLHLLETTIIVAITEQSEETGGNRIDPSASSVSSMSETMFYDCSSTLPSETTDRHLASYSHVGSDLKRSLGTTNRGRPMYVLDMGTEKAHHYFHVSPSQVVLRGAFKPPTSFTDFALDRHQQPRYR